MAKDFPPLNQISPIVDSKGRPTTDFLLLVNQLLTSKVTDAGDVAANALAQAAAALSAADALQLVDIIAGVGLSGGGLLGAGDMTIDLEDTAVTPGTYGDATHSAKLTIDQQGRVIDASQVVISGGGGGGGSPPTVINIKITLFNSGSVNATLPTGVAAGDLIIVGAHNAWDVLLPAGCIDLDNSPGANSNGRTFYKILTSGDIANGYITVAFSGSYYGSVGIVGFAIATVASLQSISAIRNGGSVGTVSRPMFGSSPATTVFIFGGARGNGAVTLAPADSTDSGTGGDGSGAVGVFTPTSVSLAELFTYAADGGGSYSSVVVVNGL